MKNIAILGSTGSIGTQTLDVARKNEDLRVVAVSAGKSVEKLESRFVSFIRFWQQSGMKKQPGI